MKAQQTKHIENCFDGSNIYEIVFDSPISKQLVYRLGEDGRVQYFDEFEKPFYKVRVNGRYDLKGIGDTNSMRVHLKTADDDGLDRFLDHVERTADLAADSPPDTTREAA